MWEAGGQNRRRNRTRPINMIFVLDISQSMQNEIQNITVNLKRLATVLSENNWDVQFAAVGFSDISSSSQNFRHRVRDFTSSELELWSDVRKWGFVMVVITRKQASMQ